MKALTGAAGAQECYFGPQLGVRWPGPNMAQPALSSWPRDQETKVCGSLMARLSVVCRILEVAPSYYSLHHPAIIGRSRV